MILILIVVRTSRMCARDRVAHDVAAKPSRGLPRII